MTPRRIDGPISGVFGEGVPRLEPRSRGREPISILYRLAFQRHLSKVSPKSISRYIEGSIKQLTKDEADRGEYRQAKVSSALCGLFEQLPYLVFKRPAAQQMTGANLCR
jgi:hypothetical protein